MTTTIAAPRARPRTPRRTIVLTVGALAGWVGLLWIARHWGRAILDSGRVIRLGAPPVVGWDDWTLDARVLFPVVTGAAAVALLPRLASRLSWRSLLLASAAVAAVWAVSLALTSGTSGLVRPTILENDEYLLDVPLVGSPGAFLRDYVDRIDEFVNHVRSHPPGFLVLLWTLDWVGLAGRGWVAGLCIAGGSAAVPAVLVATRELGDEALARRAAPFVALAPAAIWVATTADAFFAGVTAWSAVAVILALGRRDRRGDLLAVAGGAGFGIALLLSYGLVLAGAIPLVVAIVRRRLRPLLLAAAGALAVLGVAALFGFVWTEGLQATVREVEESVAKDRPLRYFAVSNLAAAGIALGPALAVALARLTALWLAREHRSLDRRLALVVGGAGLAMLVANVSGLSKGEVERIWLPYTLWTLAAGATLFTSERAARWWLVLQVGFAILFEVAVRTRW